jgi:hypothetical protein
VLLVSAWVFSNPPGYGPDEPAHYIKALGAGRGEFFGGEGGYPEGPGFGPDQLRWINQAARAIDVPAGLAPDGLPCSPSLDAGVSAGCLKTRLPPPAGARDTYVGTYQPFLYVLPGVFARVATNAPQGILLARVAGALTCLVLLAAAAALLWSPGEGGLPLVGLVVATTPMVLFLASAVSANGPEICAGICLVAAVLRLSRPGGPSPFAWSAAALAGAVLALSRSLGPGFVLLIGAIAVGLLGPRRVWRVAREGGRWAAGSAAVVLAAMAAGVGWEVTHQPHPPVDAIDGAVVSQAARDTVGYILRQQIGVFGWNEVRLPPQARTWWVACLLGVLVLAVVVARWRGRLVLAATLAAAMVVSVAVYITVLRTGFPMQGRYVLPFVVAVPLLAGELVARGGERLPVLRRLPLLPLVTVVAAGAHFAGWAVNARRSAVGVLGPLWFSGHSQWQPPLGWGPWLVVAAAGSLLLVAGGMSAYFQRPVALLGDPAAAAAARPDEPSSTAPSQVAFSPRSYEREGQELR